MKKEWTLKCTGGISENGEKLMKYTIKNHTLDCGYDKVVGTINISEHKEIAKSVIEVFQKLEDLY